MTDSGARFHEGLSRCHSDEQAELDLRRDQAREIRAVLNLPPQATHAAVMHAIMKIGNLVAELRESVNLAAVPETYR